MGEERVVVTGLGVVSALGGVEDFWSGLTSGRSAFSQIEAFDAGPYRTRLAAEIKDAGPRSVESFAARAAEAALADAGLAAPAARGRLAVIVGTTFGDVQPIEALAGRHLSGELSREELERLAAAHMPWTVAVKLAARLDARGPALTLTTACAAGNSAIIAAADQLLAGRADAALAGGVDAFSRVEFGGFSRLLAVAPDACRPFSEGRRGIMPGEGAGFLLLELESRARARGARIYADVVGLGASCDAAHVTTPDVGGVTRAIAACLADGGLSPADVDYVSAHGTGTPANDRAETAALKNVLGERARAVPVSSIKSMLGHAMGAASALEAAAACLTVARGVLPPTANYAGKDVDCDLDYVVEGARAAKVGVAVSNAFAFGGSNAVVAFSAPGRRPARAKKRPPIAVTAAVSLEEAEPLKAAEALLPGADLRAVDRSMALTLCAVRRALDEAGLRAPSNEVGLVLDGGGELESFLEFWRGMRADEPMGVDPRVVPSVLANAASSRAAIVLGLGLLNESLATGFWGGEAAAARACDWLARREGALVAGAVGATAQLLVLERAESARSRGARVLALLETAGHGFPARPDAGARPGSDCGCLAAAVLKVSRSGKPLDYRGAGFGGAQISLRMEAA